MSKRYGANGQVYIGPTVAKKVIEVETNTPEPNSIKIIWEGVDAEPTEPSK